MFFLSSSQEIQPILKEKAHKISEIEKELHSWWMQLASDQAPVGDPLDLFTSPLRHPDSLLHGLVIPVIHHNAGEIKSKVAIDPMGNSSLHPPGWRIRWTLSPRLMCDRLSSYSLAKCETNHVSAHCLMNHCTIYLLTFSSLQSSSSSITKWAFRPFCSCPSLVPILIWQIRREMESSIEYLRSQ